MNEGLYDDRLDSELQIYNHNDSFTQIEHRLIVCTRDNFAKPINSNILCEMANSTTKQMVLPLPLQSVLLREFKPRVQNNKRQAKTNFTL